MTAVPVQGSGPLDLLQLASNSSHPVANQPAVGLDLGFAGTAEKTEAAALPFQVGPAPDQPPRLIVEMGKLDLQPPFRGRCPFSENLEDQACAVDDLGPDLLFQRLLLHRSQRGIDNKQAGLVALGHACNLLDLTFAKQRGGLGRTKPECALTDNVDADCFRESDCLVQASVGGAALSPGLLVHAYDHSALAAGDIKRSGSAANIDGHLASGPSLPSRPSGNGLSG